MFFTPHMERLPAAARRGVEELAASGEVSFIVLFGSRARGSAGPLSDTDLAVATTASFADSGDLKLRYLPRLSGPGCEVDLVVLDTAPPALRFRVARDGLPLWIGDPAALHAFRVEAHRDWLDFEPFVRGHLSALQERITGGRFARGAPRHG